MQQIGVTRIGVDHHFIDFLQAVRVALRQLVVLGPEPPVRIPQRKAAKRGQHAHLFVIDDFKNRLEEIEPVAPARASISSWAARISGGSWRAMVSVMAIFQVVLPGYFPVPRNSLIES